MSHKTLGINLSVNHKDVRAIFYSKFSKKVREWGYDPEDLLQEIYAGILVRNSGSCPFDPNISSLSNYIYIVCSCIISNYHRSQCKYKKESSSDNVLDTRKSKDFIKSSEKKDVYVRISQELADPTDREIFLKMTQSYRIKEVAEALNVKPHFVKTRLKAMHPVIDSFLKKNKMSRGDLG